MATNKWRTCCTCGPFRPRWMKMVDNIYKSTANDSSSHSKLVYFCVRKPDKLDRIASYLLRHLSNNLYRDNDNNVNMSMDAINSLMNACHNQRLNLFVVSYLKMVQLLLESHKYEHQLLGCRSFMQFSQLSEDTPTYHREYEYLTQHFTKLAHSTETSKSQQNKLRVAGIKGINGVVRKSTMDQLQVNVLDLRCLNLIIPALLFNMKLQDPNELDNQDEDNPTGEALLVFRDIICRAAFNIQPVITSIFTYVDVNKLWDPPEFTLFIIDNFLENIKNTQAAYTLMKQLVSHLGNEKNEFTPQERTGIVKAINKTVNSLAAQAVGPDIFQNFKALLQILRKSIESTNSLQLRDVTSRKDVNTRDSVSPSDPEKTFQEAIISTIAEFAKNLPDTQKIEIMKFILNFDSMCFDKTNRSKQLIRVLLKTMLQVATQYKTSSISNVFNSDFLNLLLNGVAVDKDPGNRIFVQKILHTLIDRHGNALKLSQIKILDRDTMLHSFKVAKPSRQDLIFMKKTGSVIIENLFLQIIDQTNKVDNIENIYCTLTLICLEMGAEQVVVDLFRLIFASQTYILDPANKMPITHQCAVHALLAAFINTLSIIADLPAVENHVLEIISSRQAKANYFLPEVAFNRSNTANTYPSKIENCETMFFSKSIVRDNLSSKNYDTSLFDVPFKSSPGELNSIKIKFYQEKIEEPMKLLKNDMMQSDLREIQGLSTSMTSLSISESGSTIHEDESRKSTEDIYSFASIQKLLSETPDERRQKKRSRELEISKYFREAGFERICRDQREKYLPIRQQLIDVLAGSNCIDNKQIDLMECRVVSDDLPDIWGIDFPKLFVA